MTLRITRHPDPRGVRLRLTGRIRSADIREIKDQMELLSEHQTQPPEKVTVIDLEEVVLVDLEAVRFLASCELSGVELVNASNYIRDWVARERRVLEKEGN